MNWPTSCMQGDVPTLKCLEAVFANVLNAVVGLSALALFVMLLIGGFRYLTSGGEAKAAEGARNTMTYALIGMALIGLAFLIFNVIAKFTGIGVQNLLQFKIPDQSGN